MTYLSGEAEDCALIGTIALIVEAVAPGATAAATALDERAAYL